MAIKPRHAALAIIPAAILLAVTFINSREGMSLKAYEDVAGIWTICHGISGAHPGEVKTKEECNKLDTSLKSKFMLAVANQIKVPVTDSLLAAHTSFAYNIGIIGYSHSSTLKLTNEGHLKEGCQAMLNWYTAGGRDCRIHSNNCYGLISRRTDESNLCKEGL